MNNYSCPLEIISLNASSSTLDMPMLSKIYSASSKVSIPVSLASSKAEKPHYHLKNLLRELDSDDPEKDLVQLQQRIRDTIDEFPMLRKSFVLLKNFFVNKILSKPTLAWALSQNSLSNPSARPQTAYISFTLYITMGPQIAIQIFRHISFPYSLIMAVNSKASSLY
jgi:hypothetical protein